MHIENKCSQLYKSYEYRPDALNYMIQMQNELQEFVGKKRKLPYPMQCIPMDEKCRWSLYFFNAFVSEYAEFLERYVENITSSEDILEMKYEVIDMFHFLMNMHLFVEIYSFDTTLEQYFDNSFTYDVDENMGISLCVDDIVGVWGSIINELPFKTWKTYVNPTIDTEKIKSLFSIIINDFIQICKYVGITKEEFFNLYMSKNEENINRQSVNGIYSK